MSILPLRNNKRKIKEDDTTIPICKRCGEEDILGLGLCEDCESMSPYKCPRCHSKNVLYIEKRDSIDRGSDGIKCKKCHYTFLGYILGW
jgi:DNA-directed RNA polymerase subunit RPC12/RpoP